MTRTKGEEDAHVSSGQEEEEEKNADDDVDVEGLVGELERWSSHWTFQELVSDCESMYITHFVVSSFRCIL
jgi:hypothetical protein